MLFERCVASVAPMIHTSRLDLIVVTLMIGCGLAFLWDARTWAPHAYVGHDQFGDADFWWQGAIQFSRGVFWDNINFGYRMGYAIFGGLVDAVIGPNYPAFHAILILIYLSIASWAYVVLVPVLGRPVAVAMTAWLVFWPYQAEWLAISTSDGLGLIWNMTALLALCLALRDGGRPAWGAVGGLCLCLGSLTRPLMVPFVAPATVLLVCYLRGSGRVRTLSAFLAAFAVPNAIWMLAFYLGTGAVGLAGQDAGVFFAASTQKYQVWTPEMYAPVTDAAKARLGVSQVTPLQLDDEFRRQTLANYRQEYAYHLARIPGHIASLAGFSWSNFHPGDHGELAARILLHGLAAAAVALECIRRRALAAAAAALTIGVLSLLPVTAGLVVVASAIVCVLPLGSPQVRLVLRVIAAYWWIGIVALYFVGGTSGAPTAQFINALGYRLGLQFLFANGWLVLLLIAGLVPARKPRAVITPALRWWTVPAPLAGRAMMTAGITGLLLLGGLLAAGATTVGVRAWRLSHATPVPMPDTAPLIAGICAAAGQATAKIAGAESATVLADMWRVSEPDKRREGLHLFTGAVGSSIWQLQEQRRTRATFYQQDVQFPFSFGRISTQVEFAGLLDEAPWRDRQGAWFVRSFRELNSHNMYGYYDSLPKVQLFAPLAPDGRAFDPSRLEKFPLARYAAALAHEGHISAIDASLEWLTYPIGGRSRWFNLVPPPGAGETRSGGFELDVSDALGTRALRFSFRVEPLPGYGLGDKRVQVAVDAVDAAGHSRGLIDRDSPARGPMTVLADSLEIAIPPDAERVRVTFAPLSPTEMVRVLELQLVSDDVKPGLVGTLCGGP